MKAGALRHYLTVQQDTGTRDAENWQQYCTRYGEVREVSGAEDESGLIATAEVITEVYLRADYETARIAPQMRIVYTDRFNQQKTLDVLAVVDETGRGRELRITCRRNSAC